MKTPWINYEEMKLINISRQTVFIYSVIREQNKSPSDDSKFEGNRETDIGHHELEPPHSDTQTDEIDNTNDSSDDNQSLDLHRKMDDCTEAGVCQIVKKIKEIQTDLVDEKQSLPFDYFTEGNYFNEITAFANLKQVDQTDVTDKTDTNIQSKSRFNLEYISEFDFAPCYIEPVEKVNTQEKLASTRLLEPSKKNGESVKFGISQLVDVLKKLQTTHTNAPFELSIPKKLPIIDEATEINQLIDSETDFEHMHNSTVDILLDNIELDKTNSFLEDTDNPVVIEPDEENSDSIQMAIYRLVSTLKRVQIVRTEDPLELATDNNVSVIDEATKIDHENDLITDCEPMHNSTVDILLDDIEIDKSNSSLEDTEKPGGTKVSEDNGKPKQLECEIEPLFTSESGYIDHVNEEVVRDDESKNESTGEMDEFPQYGKIYCKTIKSPFSTVVEIDDFLHAPLFGEVSQNTFEFLEPSHKQSFQLDTKFISTSTYYPHKPSCHLVSTSIHEIIYLTNTPHTNGTKKNKSNSCKSIMIPIHPSPKIVESNYENDTHDFIKIRVPVVVGEYNIEICIEEEILFEEEAIRIREVSKNVVLTNCHFTPTQLSKPLGDGTCVASNGVLSIEGLIVQSIEYSTIPDRNKGSIQKKEVINLHEKITLELGVQLLQEQGIRVHYNDLKKQ